MTRRELLTRQKNEGTCHYFNDSAKMAAPKDERISVPIDDPNADTEW